jgi:hypothetical protein
MEGTDALQVIAEIAIAMAGFGGVVAGLGYRASREWSNSDRLRLNGIALRSLQVVFGCLLPFVFHHAEFGPRIVWGVSSAALGLSVLFLLIRQLVQILPRLDPDISRFATSLVVPAQAIACLLLFANAFGVGAHQAIAPYLAALLLVLFEVAVYFIRMLQTAFSARGAA